MSKSFGGLDALQEVSFAVHQGQIKAVIGPNGAGKTTLFNLVSGSYRPSAGPGGLLGVELTWPEAPHRICRMGVGRTFQHSLVFDDMTWSRTWLVGGTAH